MRLIEAVQSGDRAAVLSLIKQKADVNTATLDGTTALHWAAPRGDAETADTLLKAGARAQVANRYG